MFCIPFRIKLHVFKRKNDRIQPVGLEDLKKKHAAAPATENFGLSTPGEGQGLGMQRQAMFDCWKAGMAAPVSG